MGDGNEIAHSRSFDRQLRKWRTKLKNEPEIAGWFIDSALMNEWDRAFNHPVFFVLAEQLGKQVVDVNFLEVNPYDAVRLVMPKEKVASYDWSKFEQARDPENENLPPNPML